MTRLRGAWHGMRMKTCASSLSEETEQLQGGFELSVSSLICCGLFHDYAFPFQIAPFG